MVTASYVLMIWLGIGGGFTQEFNTLKACEYAGNTYVDKLEKHHQRWFVCVPK